VKQGLLTLAALSLAVAAALPASAQIGSGSITNFDMATFNLAEAYPATAATYSANLGITDLSVFTGVCPPVTGNPGAVPGTLCLQRAPSTFILNVNCFAVIPNGQVGPCFVQAYSLIKKVPGSFKCPDVYGLPHFKLVSSVLVLDPYQYFQFGTGIRTWWSLNFTQPGTVFQLEVVSVCRNPAPAPQIGEVRIHKDTWRWRVVADVNTLASLIELMHGGAVSTLEIPCIIGEDMYEALKTARTTLATAIAGANKTTIGDAIFNFEALIVANCLFVEVLNPVVTFPGTRQFTDVAGFQPPGNLAPLVTFGTGGTAVAGIIDTIEHPCCCKLLVDLEWIAIKNGLIGQTPTLPVF
jgi:hypothetical protein